MHTATDNNDMSNNILPLTKRRGCHISVTELAIEKAQELHDLSIELSNEKLKKYYYQIITAGLAVVLTATLFIVNF